MLHQVRIPEKSSLNKVWQLVCFWCIFFNQVYCPAGSETESDDLTVWDGNICTYLILRKMHKTFRTACCGLIAKSLSCVKSYLQE